MIQESTLIAVILADRKNDHPRLAYADWLEEQGERDRARLIRVQIELPHRPDNADDTRGLHAEEEQLEAACEKALPPLDGITWGGFERGLVRTVCAATPDDFQRHGGVIDDMVSLDRVKFDNFDGFDILAQVPVLSRFTELLGGLEELFLGEDWPHPIGPAAGQALGRSPQLTHLRKLSLHDHEIGVLGATALAQAPHVAGLTYLDIRYASGPDAARALAASPYLRQLKSLRLYACSIGDEGAKALSCSPVLATLEELDLTYNDLTDEGANALADSPYLESLNPGGLDIERGNRLTESGLQELRVRFGDRLSEAISIAGTACHDDFPCQ